MVVILLMLRLGWACFLGKWAYSMLRSGLKEMGLMIDRSFLR